uniref:Uncharacterized protein n=1 Tax=Romanomermis culicivorax TaxID=13658 RepID=A0A915JAT0_ROMCU
MYNEVEYVIDKPGTSFTGVGFDYSMDNTYQLMLLLHIIKHSSLYILSKNPNHP